MHILPFVISLYALTPQADKLVASVYDFADLPKGTNALPACNPYNGKTYAMGPAGLVSPSGALIPGTPFAADPRSGDAYTFLGDYSTNTYAVLKEGKTIAQAPPGYGFGLTDIFLSHSGDLQITAKKESPLSYATYKKGTWIIPDPLATQQSYIARPRYPQAPFIQFVPPTQKQPARLGVLQPSGHWQFTTCDPGWSPQSAMITKKGLAWTETQEGRARIMLEGKVVAEGTGSASDGSDGLLKVRMIDGTYKLLDRQGSQWSAASGNGLADDHIEVNSGVSSSYCYTGFDDPNIWFGEIVDVLGDHFYISNGVKVSVPKGHLICAVPQQSGSPTMAYECDGRWMLLYQGQELLGDKGKFVSFDQKSHSPSGKWFVFGMSENRALIVNCPKRIVTTINFPKGKYFESAYWDQDENPLIMLSTKSGWYSSHSLVKVMEKQ